jgi:hypothetical protein
MESGYFYQKLAQKAQKWPAYPPIKNNENKFNKSGVCIKITTFLKRTVASRLCCLRVYKTKDRSGCA